MQTILHIKEIARLKFCNECQHFRHTADFGIAGVCILFKKVNMVSADKEHVNALIVRQQEKLCGEDARFFNNLKMKNSNNSKQPQNINNGTTQER